MVTIELIKKKANTPDVCNSCGEAATHDFYIGRENNNRIAVSLCKKCLADLGFVLLKELE